MEIQQIEMEIERVVERIKLTREQLEKLYNWQKALESAVSVLRIMQEATGVDFGAYFVPSETKEVVEKFHASLPSGREVKPAKGKAAEAGQALLNEIRARNNYMKPMEAVVWLRDTHNLNIGLGKPGRETSDLSAALGHGKVKGLTVSRRMGWGLEEWQNQPRVAVNRLHADAKSSFVESDVKTESAVSSGSIVEQESDEIDRSH